MAGHKRPSFLKKQKEQQRKTWATEKRAARAARREAKNTEGTGPEGLEELAMEEGPPAEGESSGGVASDAEPASEDANRQ
jgi:hypothetical protein